MPRGKACAAADVVQYVDVPHRDAGRRNLPAPRQSLLLKLGTGAVNFKSPRCC